MKNKNTFVQKDQPSIINKEKEIAKKIDFLMQALDRSYPSSQTLMWRSFLHGLFVALGSTIGLTIFLAISTFTLNQFRFIPVIDSLFTLLKLR